MKVVILCGGRGLRFNEITGSIPKPLARIGKDPILEHIMKIYSYYGFNEFILALGYLGNKIKKYFLEYNKNHKKKAKIRKISKNEIIFNNGSHDWKIYFADTGEKTNTGGRIKKIEHLIKENEFMCTYGDGLADINLKKLLEFHRKKGKTATITIINPLSQFGVVETGKNNIIKKFKEKPKLNYWINGGFFVFNKKIFSYLKNNSILEKEPFEKLAKRKEINAFKHKNFWRCMDTFKDNMELNDLWEKNKALWKVWK